MIVNLWEVPVGYVVPEEPSRKKLTDLWSTSSDKSQPDDSGDTQKELQESNQSH